MSFYQPKLIEMLKLKIETINAILNYMAEQPYKEVINIIAAIQKDAKELNEMEKPEEK